MTPRFDRLAAAAQALGVRLWKTGDGRLEALHQGQRVPLQGLDAARTWLAGLFPAESHLIEICGKRNAQFQRLPRRVRQGVL